MTSDLTDIPGIGKTFARISIWSQHDLVGKAAEDLFQQLLEANEYERHKTSKNYLYVIRMAIYYAEGGRDPERLKWHAWKEPLSSR